MNKKLGVWCLWPKQDTKTQDETRNPSPTGTHAGLLLRPLLGTPTGTSTREQPSTSRAPEQLSWCNSSNYGNLATMDVYGMYKIIQDGALQLLVYNPI